MTHPTHPTRRAPPILAAAASAGTLLPRGLVAPERRFAPRSGRGKTALDPTRGAKTVGERVRRLQ
jgi:hypothetical protein